jgi:CRISPR-associated protein Csh1
MIREIINFTNNLSENFRMEGIKPKEGLHIVVSLKNEDGMIRIDTQNYKYEIYSKKMNEETPFIEKCKVLAQNAWCIDTNKCFDLPTKAIHSCSPYLVAFKKEHLEGGQKYIQNQNKNKTQIHERFNMYFEKANALFSLEEQRAANQVYQFFFTQKTFLLMLESIMIDIEIKRNSLIEKIEIEKKRYKHCKEKTDKEFIKEEISLLENRILSYRHLSDGDYIAFYLDKPLYEYKFVHEKYLSEKLFNTDKYNTSPNADGLLYGTSDFMNTFNSNMPFLSHQTASFEITGRISNKDSKALYDFKNILSRGTLPRPLPIFVIKEELNQQVIALFKESSFKIGFVEIVETLWEKYKDDFKNYYFLYWQNTKDGIVFLDYDFVSQFDYEIESQIKNLFNIKEKRSKGTEAKLMHYRQISNVFEFENVVFKPLLQNKYVRLDYFNNLKHDDYDVLKNTFHTYSKYRKSVYDYVYKSKRQGIDEKIFTDMVFSRIKDDLKNNNEYSIKEKLNIWFSLYEHFDHNKNIKETMASKLKNYQAFVAKLAVGQADLETASDQYFAFAAGQVIEYVIQKSKTDNKSYQLLEPYLQKSNCSEFKRAIASDIARYKHAINDNETRFKNVCAFVHTYETNRNLKELLPEILAGVFAKNEFFTEQYEKK